MMAVHRKKSQRQKLDLDDNFVDSTGQLRNLAEENGIRTIPLDIASLLDLFGIRVVKEPMDDDRSGYLERRRSGWVAGVNSLHHPKRQRFTLSHELAHFVLHRDMQTKFVDTVFFRAAHSTPMERQANQFAAELLMPENEFRRLVADGMTDLGQLGEVFGVSSAAVEVRAKKLDYSIAA